MKSKSSLVLILFGLGLTFGSGFIAWRAMADGNISDQQIGLIQNQANCSVARGTISRLHSSDALMRVNLGQSYESIATRLMARFNDRATASGYRPTRLDEILASYNQALDNFRSSYKSYEEGLSTTLSIDCTKRPADFYNNLLATRAKRLILARRLATLNQLIDDYESSFEDFVEDINL